MPWAPTVPGGDRSPGDLLSARRSSGRSRPVSRWMDRRWRISPKRRLEDAHNLVVEERLRISGELHGVVAHSIATISVLAGMAAHVFDDQPEQARAAVLEIRRLSKDALKQLRATLC